MLLPRVNGLVSIGNICVTCQKSLSNHGTAEFDKLPLETEPVAHGNNVVLTSKLCPQTSLVPYSTDNRCRDSTVVIIYLTVRLPLASCQDVESSDDVALKEYIVEA